MVVTCWSGFKYSNSMATRNFPFADVAAPTAGNRGPAHTADASGRSDTATEVSRLSDFTTISLLHRDVAAKFTCAIVGFEKIIVEKPALNSQRRILAIPSCVDGNPEVILAPLGGGHLDV